jgi:acyl-coenzyme A thioesterase PaaI-like protein
VREIITPPVNLNREFDLAANFLVAVADMALGQGVRASVDPNLHLVTAGLTVDFARPVRVGDWVQAQADIQHRSRRTVFASCYLVSDGHRVVRASGIYSIVSE